MHNSLKYTQRNEISRTCDARAALQIRDCRLTCTRIIPFHYLVDSENILRLFRNLIALPHASVFSFRVCLSRHTLTFQTELNMNISLATVAPGSNLKYPKKPKNSSWLAMVSYCSYGE